MANNSVEVITLLSSEDESNPQIESIPSSNRSVKVTARKSMRSGSTVKKETVPVSQNISASNMKKPSNNSLNVTTEGIGKKSARKSFKISNTQTTSNRVSVTKSSSNRQHVPIGSGLKTAVAPGAVTAVTKLPGITITPVPRSQPLPVQAGNTWFQPKAVSTPKLNTAVSRKLAPPVSSNNLGETKPLVSSASSIFTAPISFSKVPKEKSTVTSTKPFTEKATHLKASGVHNMSQNTERHISLLASLGKAGITVTAAPTSTAKKLSPDRSQHAENGVVKFMADINKHRAGEAVKKGTEVKIPVQSSLVITPVDHQSRNAMQGNVNSPRIAVQTGDLNKNKKMTDHKLATKVLAENGIIQNDSHIPLGSGSLGRKLSETTKGFASSDAGLAQNSVAAAGTRKRRLSAKEPSDENVSKRPKSETLPLVNGASGSSDASLEQNLKRISALKDSLKRMAEKPPEQGAGSEGTNANKVGNMESTVESVPYMATKDILTKKEPVKQVTSPKLSLKRRVACDPEQKKPRPPIPLPYAPLCREVVAPSSSEDSVPWSTTDDNATKFKKLLEFSKQFMSATEEEKCKIVRNFHRQLEKTNPAYVESGDFTHLLYDMLHKIRDPEDAFVHLETLLTELKAYRKARGAPHDPPLQKDSHIRTEQLASAIHSVTSTLKENGASRQADLPDDVLMRDIPSTSMQADIVENLRLAMPHMYAVPPKSTHPPAQDKTATKPSTSVSTVDKIEKRVKFLEDHLAKLHKKIRKLQSKELSLDDLDDDDSTYILEDRYKKKFQKTWMTLCKLKKRSPLVGREIDRRFSYKGSRHGDINKVIEKLVNKRKPAEKFPNYVEVFSLLKKTNEVSMLGLSSCDIEREAKDAFEDVGRELKRRRQLDEERDFGCYLTDNLERDPAEHDEELKTRLASSVLEGERKLKEIIDKYASAAMDEEDVAIHEEGTAIHEDEDAMSEEDVAMDNEDLPETEPATPETDRFTPDSEGPPSSPKDVIDIGSSSEASTEPGFQQSSDIYIEDEIEIVEEDSPLPSIAELC